MSLILGGWARRLGRSSGGEGTGGTDGADPAVAAARRWYRWRVAREYALLGVSGLGLASGLTGALFRWPPVLTTALFAVAIAAGAIEIVPRGISGVFRERSLDINFLVTVAVGGAIALGQWGEAATVVFLFTLGETLESITLARTRRSIQALMAMAPEVAQVKAPDGSERSVRLEEVPVGSVVAVRPGARIPLDGVIVTGDSTVDQAPITGESTPVDKAASDTVYAGTLNGAGYLEVRTTKPFAENTLAKIIHLVEEAQHRKAPSQRFVERFARFYTPLVVVGAVALAVAPALLFGQPFVPWFSRALVLLVIACPCALVISTPVAVVAAIGNASRHGVLIKGGVHLERAGRVRAVAFDKTGTLTRGVPEVQRVVPLGSSPLDAGEAAHEEKAAAQLLQVAAAAEARSEHPLAQAIVRAARRDGALGDGALPAVERFTTVAGQGVEAALDGSTLLVGKPEWLTARGVGLGPAREALEQIGAAGQTPVVVARRAGSAGRDASGPRNEAEAAWDVLGVIGIADELRPGAAQTVRELREAGVGCVVLLTGDSAAAAQAIARQVGIASEDVYANLLPEEKVRVLRELVGRHRRVAMVGDGVNDAPALAAATVGIAMGAGSTVGTGGAGGGGAGRAADAALETADVAIMTDDLARIPWVFRLSRSAARTIQANVTFALGTKLAVLALGAVGIANLWLAIAADTGASIVVILNGMRLLGRVRLPTATAALADPEALRRRFGLEDEDEHHAHAAHAD